MKTFPKSQVEIAVKDRKYKIDYPNTGQLIDIEKMKATLSGNSYDGISNQNTNSGFYAKYLIDMVATFNILCPDLIKDLKVKSILELNAVDSNILLKIYVKELLTWFIEWENALNSDDEELDASTKE